MNEAILSEITIGQYLEMLKTKNNPEKLEEINTALNSSIESLENGFDLHLFQLQKDMILIQCRLLMAKLEFDSELVEKYTRKLKQLKKQIDEKTKTQRNEAKDPYKAFIEWLLALKKYYGSDINRGEDLLYLASATNQMLNFFESQKQQLEKSKRK